METTRARPARVRHAEPLSAGNLTLVRGIAIRHGHRLGDPATLDRELMLAIRRAADLLLDDAMSESMQALRDGIRNFHADMLRKPWPMLHPDGNAPAPAGECPSVELLEDDDAWEKPLTIEVDRAVIHSDRFEGREACSVIFSASQDLAESIDPGDWIRVERPRRPAENAVVRVVRKGGDVLVVLPEIAAQAVGPLRVTRLAYVSFDAARHLPTAPRCRPRAELGTLGESLVADFEGARGLGRTRSQGRAFATAHGLPVHCWNCTAVIDLEQSPGGLCPECVGRGIASGVVGASDAIDFAEQVERLGSGAAEAFKRGDWTIDADHRDDAIRYHNAPPNLIDLSDLSTTTERAREQAIRMHAEARQGEASGWSTVDHPCRAKFEHEPEQREFRGEPFVIGQRPAECDERPKFVEAAVSVASGTAIAKLDESTGLVLLWPDDARADSYRPMVGASGVRQHDCGRFTLRTRDGRDTLRVTLGTEEADTLSKALLAGMVVAVVSDPAHASAPGAYSWEFDRNAYTQRFERDQPSGGHGRG